MRRVLAVAALVAGAGLVSLAPAGASGDYSGGWTDPAPGAVLDGLRGISGSVSHPHGIQFVQLQAVVPADADAPQECAAGGGPWQPVQGGGAQQVSFTFTVQFPCNIVYRVEAVAQAGAGEGTTFEPDPAPAPMSMPTTIAVAIPPEPVRNVDVALAGTDAAPTVVVEWSEGAEPDLLRYVISRDGEELGDVARGDGSTFTDSSPPSGRSVYEVKAVRSGPDGGEVSGPATGTDINVPERATNARDDDDDGGDDDGDSSSDDDGGAGSPSTDDPTIGSSRGPAGGGSAPSLGTSSRPVGGGGPPTTADTGFSETLPFGDQEAAAPPTGAPTVVASFDDPDEPPFLNRETWTFIAAGLALLKRSMVIRYVTRRAAAGY